MSRSKYDCFYYFQVRPIVKMYLIGRYGKVILKDKSTLFNLMDIGDLVLIPEEESSRIDLLKVAVSKVLYDKLVSDEDFAITLNKRFDAIVFEFFCEALINFIKGRSAVGSKLNTSVYDFYYEYDLDEEVFQFENAFRIWYRKK